jgi:hypothetical protein
MAEELRQRAATFASETDPAALEGRETEADGGA